MTKRIYKVIGTTTALKALQVEADALGVTAVGIGTTGTLYAWNRAREAAEKLSIDQAAALLNTTADQVNLIISTKGAHVIEDPTPQPILATKEPEPTPAPVVEEKAPETPQEAEPSAPAEEPQVQPNDLEVVLNTIEKLAHNSVAELRAEIQKTNAPLADRIGQLETSFNDLATLVRSLILP